MAACPASSHATARWLGALIEPQTAIADGCWRNLRLGGGISKRAELAGNMTAEDLQDRLTDQIPTLFGKEAGFDDTARLPRVPPTQMSRVRRLVHGRRWRSTSARVGSLAWRRIFSGVIAPVERLLNPRQWRRVGAGLVALILLFVLILSLSDNGRPRTSPSSAKGGTPPPALPATSVPPPAKAGTLAPANIAPASAIPAVPPKPVATAPSPAPAATAPSPPSAQACSGTQTQVGNETRRHHPHQKRNPCAG
jgi:hypothetical protein